MSPYMRNTLVLLLPGHKRLNGKLRRQLLMNSLHQRMTKVVGIFL
jgi:hypothetical protein